MSDKPTLIYLFINPGGGGITLFSFSLGEGDLSPRLGEEVVCPLVSVSSSHYHGIAVGQATGSSRSKLKLSLS